MRTLLLFSVVFLLSGCFRAKERNLVFKYEGSEIFRFSPVGKPYIMDSTMYVKMTGPKAKSISSLGKKYPKRIAFDVFVNEERYSQMIADFSQLDLTASRLAGLPVVEEKLHLFEEAGIKVKKVKVLPPQAVILKRKIGISYLEFSFLGPFSKVEHDDSFISVPLSQEDREIYKVMSDPKEFGNPEVEFDLTIASEDLRPLLQKILKTNDGSVPLERSEEFAIFVGNEIYHTQTIDLIKTSDEGILKIPLIKDKLHLFEKAGIKLRRKEQK